MYDRRQRLIEVFQDTQKYYTENEQLADAVAASRKARACMARMIIPPCRKSAQHLSRSR